MSFICSIRGTQLLVQKLHVVAPAVFQVLRHYPPLACCLVRSMRARTSSHFHHSHAEHVSDLSRCDESPAIYHEVLFTFWR